jgi:hypothetical protein
MGRVIPGSTISKIKNARENYLGSSGETFSKKNDSDDEKNFSSILVVTI